MLLYGNTVVTAAVVLDWCIMYQGPYLPSTLTPSSQDLLFSTRWWVSASVHHVFPATFSNGATTHKFYLTICRQAHGMLFYCNNISPRAYFSCIWKIKKSGLPQWGGNDPPPPPSSVTRCIRNDSIFSLMLLQERGSISVLCFLLWSYFSPPHSSVNVSTPSVISQSIWPRNIIVTSCWGSTLNIWGITRPVFRLKIVVLVYMDFFFLVMLLEMQYLKFRFKLQKCVQELVNWANSCSLCHQLSTQEPLMITCERFQSCKMKLQ